MCSGYYVLNPRPSHIHPTRHSDNTSIREPDFFTADSFATTKFTLPPITFDAYPIGRPTDLKLTLTLSAYTKLTTVVSSATTSVTPESIAYFVPHTITVTTKSPPSIRAVSGESLTVLPRVSPRPVESEVPPDYTTSANRTPVSDPSFFGHPGESLVARFTTYLPSQPLTATSGGSTFSASTIDAPTSCSSEPDTIAGHTFFSSNDSNVSTTVSSARTYSVSDNDESKSKGWQWS